MDSIFSDPTKCSNLTLDEKRALVHEISQWAYNAPEILQSWSRRDLLLLICAEMGKERKYTGVPKQKMIEHLLKLVSQNNAKVHNRVIDLSSALPKKETGPKGKRKKETPQTLANLNQGAVIAKIERPYDICKNPVCRAPLKPDIGYCKRCSCCICHNFDENKDPSLWLNCNSDPPFCSESCGMSCHLECALKQEKAGILKTGHFSKLDGSFYCVCCGKMNWLIGCWRKQLLIAKEARRVYVLCIRLSLVHKMLKGSEYYKELENIVSVAVKTLKKEVGPLDKVSYAMARGIVNRLNCGAEVQKLCASAFEAVDSLFSRTSSDFLANSEMKSSGAQALSINFEDISPFSVVVSVHSRDHMIEDKIIGCTLWHRSSDSMDYPEDPTCLIMRPDTKITISGLYPSAEYCFKVSPFSTTKELGKWEAKCMTENINDNICEFSIRNSASIFMHENIHPNLKKEQELDEPPVIIQADSQKGSTNSSENNHDVLPSEDTSDNNQRHLQVPCNTVPFLSSDSSLDVTLKPDRINSTPDSANKKESTEREYEYCVKVIRWLECEEHMEKDFRVKFLTWFSLKATAQERRVVSAFIDVLIDEPASLVSQLKDAFIDGVSNKEKPVSRTSLHNKLWL